MLQVAATARREDEKGFVHMVKGGNDLADKLDGDFKIPTRECRDTHVREWTPSPGGLGWEAVGAATPQDITSTFNLPGGGTERNVF